MSFDVIGEISNVETFAIGSAIRELPRLRRIYGAGRWRKCKGLGRVRLEDGSISSAELRWYEANGVLRVETNIERLLNE